MPKSKEFISSSESDSDNDQTPTRQSVVKHTDYSYRSFAQRVIKEESLSEIKLHSSSEPKQKKKKVEKKEKKEKTESKKEEKSSSSKGPGGEYMFQLSKMRFATVSQFRGNVMVGIREFYDAGGELKPGKKGISLSKDQWKKLKEHIDEIDDAVKDLS